MSNPAFSERLVGAAGGTPEAPLCISPRGAVRSGTDDLKPPGSAKALTLYQTQGGGGDTEWRD